MSEGSTSPKRSGPGGAQRGLPFDASELDSLSPLMRRLVNALMLYKSLFSGPWFEALSKDEEPTTKEMYDRIMSETTEQSQRALDLLHRWDRMPEESRVEAIADQVLKRLLEDMLSLKKSSTEVFLGAGIGSPTEEMRREFLDLANVDRQHADSLRAALRTRDAEDDSSRARSTKGFAGVHAGPFPVGTLSTAVQSALERARGSGHEPIRIIMSGAALRHLRDEGSVTPRQGEVFGLPVDVDLAWEGDAFAIASHVRVSLAEIVTEMEAGDGASPYSG